MKLLLVEDELKLGRALKAGLSQDGYAVELVSTAEDGLACALNDSYDVIVLDRMLPDGQDGLDICRKLRASKVTTPVLMLTALGEMSDKVQGLDDGADDYLVKPFDFEELLARLRALQRRPQQSNAPNIPIGSLVLHTSSKQVETPSGMVRLSKREYALLEYLAMHQDRIFSKEELIDHVWEFDADILPNTVEVFVRGIRKKLDITNKPSIIETVRGFGYRIRGEG